MAELEQIRITYPNTTNPEDFHNDFSNLSLNSTTSLLIRQQKLVQLANAELERKGGKNLGLPVTVAPFKDT